MTTEEVQEIIDEIDENKDGKLDYKEVSYYHFHLNVTAMVRVTYYKEVSYYHFHFRLNVTAMVRVTYYKEVSFFHSHQTDSLSRCST